MNRPFPNIVINVVSGKDFSRVSSPSPKGNSYLLMPTVSCDEIDECVITIRYTHYSREWALVQNVKYGPINTDSDVVENDLGFVGAYRADTNEVRFQEDPE